MRIVKAQVILFMYEKLLFDETLDPIEVKTKFELADKTLYRYIQEINAYYCNMYENKKIHYDRKNKKYYLKEK